MNLDVLREGEDIFQFLAEKLVAEEKDFSKNLVVFTGRRPAFFLLDTIKNRLKTSFIPPVVLSIDEFIDHCYEKELGIKDIKIEALSGCKIIKDLIGNEAVFGKQHPELNQFLPLGFRLFSVFEELLLAGVNKQRLKEVDNMIDAKNSLENIIRLSDIYERFYRYVFENGMSTRALRYKKVSEEVVSLKSFERIIFAGFFAATECEKRLFKKFYNDHRVTLVFQGESAKDYFFENRYSPHYMPVENIELFECPDSHSQVFKLSEILAEELKHKKGKENFLIIVPSSDTLIPLLNALPLKSDEYNISLGYPLIRTPIYSFIKHLFDLVKSRKDDKFYVPDYLKFVLHPYTKNILVKNKAETARVIFHTLEQKLLENQFKVYVSKEELNDEKLLTHIYNEVKEELTYEELKSLIKEIHDKTIEKLVNLDNIKDFAKKMKEIVNFVYERTTAKKHIMFFPYSETMLLAITELECSLFAEERFSDIGDYFDFFKKFVTLYNVPFHGTPLKDVQILGFLEARNLKFDNVFILDLNEGIIPNSEKEDEILPFDVRKRLGVPTYEEKDRIFEFYLRSIITGTKRNWLFYVEDDSKEKSRFIEKIIWEKQKKENTTDNRFCFNVSYKFNLSPYKPQPVEKNAEIKETLRRLTYTATMVDTYYDCPLKFYYKFVLLPREGNQIFEEPEGRHVGTIIHDILRDYYVSNTDYDDRGFNNLLEHRFQKTFGSEQSGKIFILKKQIQKKLSDFIKNYKTITGCNSLEIVALETKFSTALSLFGNHNIRLEGILDRIEKRDGQVFIVDFKKSSRRERYQVNWHKFDYNNREDWKKAFKSVQLIFYTVLLNRSDYAEKPHNASYFLLEEKFYQNMEVKLFKDEVLSTDLLETVIKRLLEEILGEDTFSPIEELSDCKYCLYKQLCWK